MRVLWFEISVPARYDSDKNPTCGWQDSLQDVVMQHSDIELGIAFEYHGSGEIKTIDGIKYFPINVQYNIIERQYNKIGWECAIENTIDKACKIIEDYKPDIIHVFGSEWQFGLVAERTKIPVVIHMQGSIPPYNNASLPPKYSTHDLIKGIGRFNIHNQVGAWLSRKKDVSRQQMEERILRCVKYYMGRTDWDKNLVKLFNPQCKYYYCSEALRPSFVKSSQEWTPPSNKKFRIVTTGISTFWKGIDTILRTANLLKQFGLDFEWIMVGSLSDNIRRIVERKEKLKYIDCNCKITGFVNQDKLRDILMSSDLYVHTAYIDNSPNALCEAQYLGLPIIATYVGGIPSLVDDGVDGILVPANAPYTLAGKIKGLLSDVDKRKSLGRAARQKAIIRHNPDNIYSDLMACYNNIISDK